MKICQILDFQSPTKSFTILFSGRTLFFDVHVFFAAKLPQFKHVTVGGAPVPRGNCLSNEAPQL